jgi:hypothetical protein
MCLDPLSIAALALTTAGTVKNANTQNRAIEAQNEANWNSFKMADQARRAEQERQSNMEAERRGTFLDVAEAVDPSAARAELDENAEAALNEVLDNRIADPNASSFGFGSGEADEALSATANRVVADKRAELEAANRLRAANMGFSDDASALRRGVAAQDFIGDRMRGSLGVSTQERNITPPTYRPGSTLLGDLMIAGGTVGANRAGYNAGQQSVGVGAG